MAQGYEKAGGGKEKGCGWHVSFRMGAGQPKVENRKEDEEDVDGAGFHPDVFGEVSVRKNHAQAGETQPLPVFHALEGNDGGKRGGKAVVAALDQLDGGQLGEAAEVEDGLTEQAPTDKSGREGDHPLAHVIGDRDALLVDEPGQREVSDHHKGR